MIEKYIKKFIDLLREKIFQYFLLIITFILLLIVPVKGEIKYFLIILFYVSFVIQDILLIKRNYALFITRVFLIIFLSFEYGFGILNSEKKTKQYYYSDNIYISDTILGYRLRPDCWERRSYKIYGSDTAYNAYYSSDKFGRRVSKESILSDYEKEHNVKMKHAIFLGCSFTFGEGLRYCSTFPSLFENMHPDFQSYNYGVMGYGPHQICLLFDEGINTINNYTIPEDSGFCIYTYIDEHMDRVYGGSDYLSNPGFEKTPDVYVENNKLICKKRSNIQIKIAWLLNNSETMRAFGIKSTYPKTEEFYKRFAEIINYTAKKYWYIKPHGDFYIGLYPMKGYIADTTWIRYLNRKIKILNIPPPNDFESNSSYRIKYDGHPTKELNLYYVKEISKLIFKTN